MEKKTICHLQCCCRWLTVVCVTLSCHCFFKSSLVESSRVATKQEWMKNVNERAVWSFNCMCYTGEKYCTWKSKVWFLAKDNFWIVFLYVCFSLRLYVFLQVSLKSCSYSWKQCIYQTTQVLNCFTVLWLVWLQQALFFFLWSFSLESLAKANILPSVSKCMHVGVHPSVVFTVANQLSDGEMQKNNVIWLPVFVWLEHQNTAVWHLCVMSEENGCHVTRFCFFFHFFFF